MRQIRMKFGVLAAVFLAVLLLRVFLPSPVAAQDDTIFVSEGIVQTGVNHLLGEPVFDAPVVLAMLGEYVEGTAEPNPLTADTPGDALVATIWDPGWEVFGAVAPDESLVNLPLRDVPIIIDDGGNRSTLPDMSELGAFGHGRVPSNGPITLDMWLSATSEMTIDCSADEATIRFESQNLIPNGLYTTWAVVALPDGEVIPLPFGGVPNAFVADPNGSNTFERTLNACPMTVGEDGIVFLWATIAHHPDMSIYGTWPDHAKAGLTGGVVVMDHVSFPALVPLASASE